MANTDAEFAEGFNEFYPSLCRFLECLLGGATGAAREIAQESFMRLYRTGFKGVVREEARFWLFRVARNLPLNELAKRSTRQRLFGRVVIAFRTETPGPAERLEEAERKEMILSLLSREPIRRSDASQKARQTLDVRLHDQKGALQGLDTRVAH